MYLMKTKCLRECLFFFVYLYSAILYASVVGMVWKICMWHDVLVCACAFFIFFTWLALFHFHTFLFLTSFMSDTDRADSDDEGFDQSHALESDSPDGKGRVTFSGCVINASWHFACSFGFVIFAWHYICKVSGVMITSAIPITYYKHSCSLLSAWCHDLPAS